MFSEEQPMQHVVEATPDEEMIHLASLVLSAAGIPHVVQAGAGGWHLLVEEGMRLRAREELGLFVEENRNWPPARLGGAEEAVVEQAPPVLPVMAALVGFYAVTGGWGMHNNWFDSGAIIREKVLSGGEWWRLVTALTLHADSVHLLGNTVLGGVLAYALCRHLGSGLAWFSVLLSGFVANGVNVYFHDELYRSVGFSTAVFGMVGLLSGMRLRRVGGWQEMVLALGSGASLLALLGSSGERTDLGAHFWGIGIGFLLGVLLVRAGFAGERRLGATRQWLLFLGAMGIVAGSWFWALAA